MSITKHLSVTPQSVRENTIKKFNSFFSNVYYDPLVRGYSFIFMVRPQLFISAEEGDSDSKKLAYNNMLRSPFFTQYVNSNANNSSQDSNADNISNDRLLLDSLSIFSTKTKIGFLPIITNLCNSFETMEVTLEEIESFETKEGFRMPLPTYKTRSEAAGQFQITFNESQNLDITKLFSLWVNYISNITDGTFSANPSFIKNRILDYMTTVYYFTLGPDGKTLKYWSKYTGCYPTNIPYNAFGYQRGNVESTEVAISFSYTLKEDMNPEILEDFNYVSLGDKRSSIKFDEKWKDNHFSTSSTYLNFSEDFITDFLSDNENTPIVRYNNKLYTYQLLFPVNTQKLTGLLDSNITFDNETYRDYYYDQVGEKASSDALPMFPNYLEGTKK